MPVKGRDVLMRIVDLRSDTKTKPTPEMRRAMFEAEVGDDVSREDPTVNELEETAARMLGKEAGLFLASGTMGNLACLLTHCRRGHEIIVGEMSHIYWAEVASAAAFGGIAYHAVPNEGDGTLDPATVREAIRPDNIHFPETGLICLENTQNRQGGVVLPLSYLAKMRSLADEAGLPLHLDGARIFNAATYLGIPASEIARYFDSVQFCVSKGLGAPVGSLVVGTEDFVDRARKTRKMLGGGMRQAGVIAAAGLTALTEMVDRLADDHLNARVLAEGLAEMPGLEVDLGRVQTNIVNVVVTHDEWTAPAFEEAMGERGVLFHALGPTMVRMVTHADVDRSDIVYALECLGGLLR
jgi:threonine aldolase